MKIPSENLHLHKEIEKMVEHGKDLELDLQSTPEDLNSTKNRLEELTAASNELLKHFLGTG